MERGSVSSGNGLLSYGRQHYFDEDKQLDAGKSVFFYRHLSSWGSKTYPSLVKTDEGGNVLYAVIYECGNLVVPKAPPEGHATTTVISGSGNAPDQQPAPEFHAAQNTATAPADTAEHIPDTTTTVPSIGVLVPLITSTAPNEGTPSISIAKSAILVSAANGSRKDANGTTAQPGDTIEYKLTTSNNGTAGAKNYVISEVLSDVLEYADVDDRRGGTLQDGRIIWPPVTIGKGSSAVETFTVRVKSVLPTTAMSTSNPQSFDMRMDNAYGNVVSIGLPAPLPKQVEAATATLPDTGPSTSSFIVVLLAAAIAFFYYRNRQLILEVQLLRGDHHGNGGAQ